MISEYAAPTGLMVLGGGSTKMSLLTELGAARVRLACTANPTGPSLYHLLEVMVMGGLRGALTSF